MEVTSPPFSPPESDPALFDDWVPIANSVSAQIYSEDDVEALHLVQEESIVRKNQQGQVIQHRAWRLDEAFRSDLDHFPESPIRARNSTFSNIDEKSSPPKMPSAMISSPVVFPQSSSPPIGKRPAPVPSDVFRKPKIIGGFLEDSDEEDEEENENGPAPKRRIVSGPKSPLEAKIHGILTSTSGNASGPQTLPSGKTGSVGGCVSDEDVDANDELRTNAEAFNVTERDGLDRTSPSPIRRPFLNSGFADTREVKTCSGKWVNIRDRPQSKAISYEELAAARSTTKAGRAKKSYYGIDIHQLVDDASKENERQVLRRTEQSGETIPTVELFKGKKSRRTLMWTEKYRARRFFDLCGDDRTHREVLRWLKGWDSTVFPKAGKAKPVVQKRPGMDGEQEEKRHRKILLLTGPPGLGKTTLAHVCAAQAGYEVMEINASDERSSNIVKGRIRTAVGTESVKSVGTTVKDGEVKKAARPACVVVDEVDGVVTGSGGSGEGGFIKTLIDLIQLDAKNESGADAGSNYAHKKKGDNFRLLRPLILICNDVYHPSLRPLRNSNFAEIIHIRKPPLEAVVNRMKSVFEREGVDCDSDGIRKLCEATWGMSSGPEARLDAAGTGEGDLRSILVVGEWVAAKLRATSQEKPRLTRKWVETNMLPNLSHEGSGARSVGRGGSKEVVSRVFLTGAGFPKPTSLPLDPVLDKKSVTNNNPTIPKTKLHTSEIAKKAGIDRLRQIIDTSGETDRIMTDIFSIYPNHAFNDDSLLSKPDAAYEWLHFHDACSSRVFSSQDWELAPYLTQPVLACHSIFAAPARHYSQTNEKKKWNNNNDNDDGQEEKELPFSGPRADYDAKEAEKSHRATITEMQTTLNATLLRSFRSPEEIATDLLPYLVRMLTPDVKPIIVGGSGDQRGVASVRREGEREMVRRAVEVMGGFNVTFERGKIEGDFGSQPQWVYRMEPPLDTLIDFPTSSSNTSTSTSTTTTTAPQPVRYAVRQVLSQEHAKAVIVRENSARQARYKAGSLHSHEDQGDEEDGSANSYLTTQPGSRNAAKRGGMAVGAGGEKGGEEIEKVKRDFFGRIIVPAASSHVNDAAMGADDSGAKKGREDGKGKGKGKDKIWVTFHEGFSNAVRKPITLEELMRGF